MNILITGASGYVGRNLEALLVARGHVVVRFPPTSERRSAGKRERLNSCYDDNKPLVEALQNCDAVVHLVGLAHHHHRRLSNPGRSFYEVNVNSSRIVAEAAASCGVSKFIFLSSVSVFGLSSSDRTIDDSQPAGPIDFYGCTKYLAEMIIGKIFAGHRTELVILRPPLVYGPNCPGNLNLLLRLCRRLPWLPLDNIQNARTLISISNLCSAIESVIVAPPASDSCYVIADPVSVSTSDIVESFCIGLGRSSFNSTRCSALCGFCLRIMMPNVYEKLFGSLVFDSSGFQRRYSSWKPSSDILSVFRDMARHS
jgi:nucleoside-diphosphate-sugar epimerase